jgi:hypothetical protein
VHAADGELRQQLDHDHLRIEQHEQRPGRDLLRLLATSGNSWTTTTCPRPVTTGPTPIASCTPIAASSSNSWTDPRPAPAP